MHISRRTFQNGHSMVLQGVGGRKFILSVLGMTCITILALAGADPTSYGAIALIVGSYAGANGYIEGKYADKNLQSN